MSVRLTRERSGVRAPLLPLAIARKSLAAEAVEKILKKIKKEVDFFQEIVYDSFVRRNGGIGRRARFRSVW